MKIQLNFILQTIKRPTTQGSTYQNQTTASHMMHSLRQVGNLIWY